MAAKRINWFYYAAPPRFYVLAGRCIPWFAVAALLLAAVGLVIGLGLAPTDFQQGDSYRIIYIHVPVSWMSMVLYLAMAFWAAIGMIFNARLAYMLAQAIAPTGALMAFLSLWTGALWGKPTWGTWWVWDARLTSMLVLLFLYVGYIALANAFDDRERGSRAAAILALAGLINLPIIKFSVDWWYTLHQPASVLRLDGPTIHSSLLVPLLVMAAGFLFYFVAVLLLRIDAGLMARKLEAMAQTGRGK